MQWLAGQRVIVIVVDHLMGLCRNLPGAILRLWHGITFRSNFVVRDGISHYSIRNYHAYASGASPPGPGQISSSFVISALLNLILSARRAPVNCSSVRGPMIGAVTTGFVSSQANAASAGFSPICLQ